MREVGVQRVGAGEDDGIQAVAREVVEVFVMAVDVGLHVGAARHAGDGEDVDVELRDAVGVADEAQELALGGFERAVGHEVQQADVQFADVLLAGAADVEDFLAFGAQAVKRFEFAVGNERHQTLLCAA